MALKTDYIVGKQTEKTWSNIYGYIPEDPKELEALGEMYAVARFSSEVEDFAIEKFAKILIESLQTAYFIDLKDYKSTLDRLEEACWKMKSKMDLLLAREAELSEVGIDVEMAIVVYRGNYLYGATIGESKVFIEREGSFVDITEGFVDRAKKGLVKSASLEMFEGDKLCIATSNAYKNLLNFEEALTNLNKNKLIEKGSQEGVGLLFVAEEGMEWFKGEVEKKVEPKINEDIEVEETTTEEIIQNDAENLIENNPGEEMIDEVEEKIIETNTGVMPIRRPIVEEDFEDEMDSDEENYDLDKPKLSERVGIFGKNLFAKAKSIKNKVQDKIQKKDESAYDILEDEYLMESESDEEYVEVEDVGEEKGGIAKYASVPIALGKTATSKVKNHFKDNKTTYAHIINTIVATITKLAEQAYEIFSKEILGRNVDRRMMSKQRVKRNRYILIIGIFIISIFLFSTINGRNNSRAKKEALATEENTLASYQSELTQIGNKVVELQYSGGQDKQQILANIDILKGKVTTDKEALETNNLIKSEKDQLAYEYTNILNALIKEEDELLLVNSFAEPQTIADFSSQFSDASITDIEYSEGYIFASDEERDVIYRLEPIINTSIEIHETKVTSPGILTRNAAGEIIVYDRDPTKSVISKFNPTQKDSLVRFENLIPQSVGRPEESTVYAENDALYEIRQVHNQIFRRDKSGDGYENGGATFQSQNPPNWKQDPELNKGIDIAVQYQVYVLVQDLGIRRYLAGGANNIVRESFLNTLDKDYNTLQSATAIAVTIKHLVVADPLNKRVMLFEITDPDLNFRFTKQFVYRGTDDNIFTDIKEVLVNEADNAIYVLDANRVIRLDIQ